MKPRARFLFVLLSLGMAGCQSETAGPDPNALIGPSFQTAQDDITPPTLTALSFSPTAINTETGSAIVTVSYSATDDLSGVAVVCGQFTSPSGLQSSAQCASDPTSTNQSGSFNMSFPQFGESGLWQLQIYHMRDAVGNGRVYSTADLAAAGFPTELTVTSIQDVTQPVLTALSFSPTAINTETGSAIVTVSYSATDDLSGVAVVCGQFTSPSGLQSSAQCASDPTSTNQSGSFNMSFPQFGESGLWQLQIYHMRDAVGNGRVYSTADLAAAGFPTDLQVNPTAPITLYLHGTGGSANPATLVLNDVAPTGAAPKFKDSPSVNFAGGNPWKQVGTWTASPAKLSGVVTSLGDAHVWVGLKNSDDVGTRFDVRVEAHKNGTVFAAGETLCLQNIVRNPNQAKEVFVGFAPFAAQSFNGTSDVVSLRILTRVGTNGSGGLCGGHSNAAGLRIYFDATSKPAGFEAVF